jgi:hypothetical protein
MAKNAISANRAGMAVGLVFAIWQAALGALLLLFGGFAVSGMYSMYMMNSGTAGYAGFSLIIYVAGIIAMFAMGWVTGWLFAHVWNRLKD